MTTVNGNITIRAGSEDYITLQLLQDDGITPIDLSAATKIVLKMQNVADDSIKNFGSDDAPQKLFIIDAVNGKIQLRPAAADFASATRYKYYVEAHDSIGVHPVPEDKFYYFSVFEKIGS